MTLQDIFTYDFRAGTDELGRYAGTLKWTGIRPKFLARLEDRGITLRRDFFLQKAFAP